MQNNYNKILFKLSEYAKFRIIKKRINLPTRENYSRERDREKVDKIVFEHKQKLNQLANKSASEENK